MEYRDIAYEVRGSTALITLDRPDHLNAFTVRMAQELIDVFDRTDADDSVKAVVVTGAGRAFCAGADLSMGGASFDLTSVAESSGRAADSAGNAVSTGDGGADADGATGADGTDLQSGGVRGWGMVGEGNQQAPADLGGMVVLRIYESLKPVIAAINGPAVGVGITMTLPMDVRMGVEGSKFGFVFNRRGISIDGAASWFLPRVVGIGQALDWVDTGRVFLADEALSGGLITSVYADRDALLDAAVALADEIADNCAAVSVTVSRRLLWDAMGDSSPVDAHRRESVALYRRGRSSDVRAGVTAFLEKSQPNFVDRVSTSNEVHDRPR
ncbi:MAG: enoyl-CoA hydratase-related protein [Microthrixaceae bacterium]